MSDREDAHQIHRSTVDSPVVADGTREGDIDDLPLLRPIITLRCPSMSASMEASPIREA